MSRATHLNPFAGTPKKEGGANPFLKVHGALIEQVANTRIDDATERRMIDQAEYYAKRNGLSFTRNMASVLKMTEHAQKMHEMHMSAMAAHDREEWKPDLVGYDRVSGFER